MIVILSTVHGHGSGAEAILDGLLKSARDLSEPICLVAPPDSSAFDVAEAEGLKVFPLLTGRDGFLENTYSVLRMAGQLRGCRLVHAWHARGFEQAWWLGRNLNIPATGTLHDHPEASFHGYFRRHLVRYSSDRLQGVVCVSQSVLEACLSSGYKGNLNVIRNGIIDQDRPDGVMQKECRKITIGYLGMHASLKGFSVVNQWIREGMPENVEWRLYGELNPLFSESVARLRGEFPGRVMFEGRRSTAEIFSKIDLLVHPSVEFDSFPTALLEAARAGIPAVASDTGGTSEIVEHGRTGFVYKPETQAKGWRYLEMLFSSLLLRKELGLAARRKYENQFRVTRMVHDYDRYWMDILDPMKNRSRKCR